MVAFEREMLPLIKQSLSKVNSNRRPIDVEKADTPVKLSIQLMLKGATKCISSCMASGNGKQFPGLQVWGLGGQRAPKRILLEAQPLGKL